MHRVLIVLDSIVYIKSFILKELSNVGNNSKTQEQKLREIKYVAHWKRQDLNPSSPTQPCAGH